jgi:predicted transcriptional regulator
MGDQQNIERSELLAQTTEIVIAYLSNNAVAAADLPSLIDSVFGKLTGLAGDGAAVPEEVELVPAVPVRRSVTDDYIVCLEDGKRLKMLKRHLMSDHGLTPEQYRARWGLKPDYPMVAPAYAETRKALAIKLGLGRKPAPPPTKPRGRRRQAPA